MRYNVTLASYPICGLHPATIGPIPGTMKKMVLETEAGLGREIWWGYLQMREEQKKTGRKAGWPFAGIELSEKAPELPKFQEAINLFFRFLAGEGRDNCQRVYQIEEAGGGGKMCVGSGMKKENVRLSDRDGGASNAD